MTGSGSCAPGSWSRSRDWTSCVGCGGSRSMSASPVTISGWTPPCSCRAWPRPARSSDRHLVLQLTGGADLGPVLRRLADADPVALGVREPSLEEIFLEYYGDHS